MTKNLVVFLTSLWNYIRQQSLKNPKELVKCITQPKHPFTRSLLESELVRQVNWKRQFKQLNYYSMPESIPFVLRKRLNFLCYTIYLLLFICWCFLPTVLF